MSVPLYESVLGAALVFALPGYAWTKAVFPDWRVRGSLALLRVVQIGALSLILSVGTTILVGFALVNAPGPGFQAFWSDPVVESLLAGIAGVGFATGVLRGAYARTPPLAPAPEPGPPTSDPMPFIRHLDELSRRARRLRHELRRADRETPAARARERELADIEREAAELRAAKELEHVA